jgi:hypothetical protein
MGVTAAAGSFGQFLMVPVSSWLIAAPSAGRTRSWCWPGGAADHAAGLGAEGAAAGGAGPGPQQSIMRGAARGLRLPSFQLLMAGYFVCGFQVVFIGVHLPSYLKDQGLGLEVATTALALIGLFNVFGTYLPRAAWGSAGQAPHPGGHLPAARSVAIALFIGLPLTPRQRLCVLGVMGLLWLSTVPPTNAIVAQIFGVQVHFSMLGGFVFLSHQVGSFLGVWLGGLLYDSTGSYDVVWWIAIALGVFAALINLPVRETAIVRPRRSRHDDTQRRWIRVVWGAALLALAPCSPPT